MWGMFAGNVVFVICGLVLLRTNFAVAVITIACFGYCAITIGMELGRKLRADAPAYGRVELAGGMPLRPSRLLPASLALAIAAFGVMFMVFGSRHGVIIQGVGLGLAVLGCVFLAGVMIGWLPMSYLQFDPVGITLGRRGFAYTVPWDNISALGTEEINDDPVILIRLHQPRDIAVTPPQRTPEALHELSRCERSYGAHVFLTPLQYRMDASRLTEALDRYVREPRTRAELSGRLIRA